jgi:hypothetical protein
MGYGTTLGSWHLNGRAPLEVTCTWNIPDGLEVDEHAIAVLRYPFGLSKTETRWGTFTDPWTHQPQPKCGFVLTGGAVFDGAWGLAITGICLVAATGFAARMIRKRHPAAATPEI